MYKVYKIDTNEYIGETKYYEEAITILKNLSMTGKPVGINWSNGMERLILEINGSISYGTFGIRDTNFK